MNVPSNYLAALGHGKNADQTAEDGRLFVPPILVPAFDVPRPAICDDSTFNGGTVIDSLVFTIFDERTNQAAADLTAFYILAGLWRLEFSVSVYWFKTTALPTGSTHGQVALMDQAGARSNITPTFFTDGTSNREVQHREFSRYIHIKPRPDLSVVQGDVWTCFIAEPATNANAADFWGIEMTVNAQRFL